MTYDHLQADCLYTGISSGPNARCRVWEAFNFLRLNRNVMKTLLCISALYRCCSVYFSSNVCLMCRLIYAPSFSITSAFPTVTDLRCFHSHCILHNLLINSFSKRNKSICLQKKSKPDNLLINSFSKRNKSICLQKKSKPCTEHSLTFRVRRCLVIATKPVHRLQIRPTVHN